MTPHAATPRVTLAGRIARAFLTNRELSVLTVAILLVWGIAGFVLMPKQYNPEITAPAFVIETAMPGASARDAYEIITRPMEDALREIPAVDKIASQSRIGGASIVTVRFAIGADVTDAKTALTQKLRDKMVLLPVGAQSPQVRSLSPDDVPVMAVAVTADTLSPQSLRKIAFDVADDLKHADGVGIVEIVGAGVPLVAVDVDTDALAARHLTVADVAHAVAGATPGTGVYHLTDNDRVTTLAIDGVADADALARVALPGGARVGDVASVALRTDTDVAAVRTVTKDASTRSTVFVALSKRKGADILTVTDAITARLDAVRAQPRYAGVTLRLSRDDGAVTRKEIRKLTGDLVISIVIVAGVLLVLLGARSALVVALAIPLVLLAVFGTGVLFDQTINRITLFALILSLGLLVDDAIVVVENVGRFLRDVPRGDAAARVTAIVAAVGEVGTALTMATLTMALAFIPMAFVTGMMGPYMGPIPFFVPVALAASLLLAFSLTPFLASWLLVPHTGAASRIAAAFGRLEDRYARLVARLVADVRARRIMLGLVGVALVASMALPAVGIVPFRMLPKADKKQFAIYVDLPDDASLAATTALVESIEKVALEDPDIVTVESFIGTPNVTDFNGLFRGSSFRSAPSQATLTVSLTDQADRSVTSEDIATRLRAALAPLLARNPRSTVGIVEDPPGPPVSATLHLKVQGPDGALRERIAADLAARVAAVPGTVDRDTSVAEPLLDATYRVDREKAASYGVTVADVTAALAAAVGGDTVGIAHQSGREAYRTPEQTRVVVRAAATDRADTSVLERVTVRTAQGATVPVARVLVRDDRYVERRILSDDRYPTEYVTAEMQGRSVIYAVIDLLPAIMRDVPATHGLTRTHWSPWGAEYAAPDGATYRVMIGGEWELTLEVFRDLGIVMGIVMLIIYVVLAAQARSFAVPLLVMSSIPLSLVGILPGFAVLHMTTGTYFNATSMIGVIALAGLAVKNGIIYLEYVGPLLARGVPLARAVVDAGRVRLLPITLTSATAVLGSLTIISDPVWEGLAWALIFGLTASTILTMIVLPVLYYLYLRRHHKA